MAAGSRDPRDPQACLTLASLLLLRHQSGGDAEAVAEAEQVLRTALANLPDDHALRPSLLNELGTALGIRHALDNNDTDAVDEAISLFEQARELVPVDDRRWHIYSGNLSNALAAKFGAGEILLAEALAYFQHFETSGDIRALELARNRLQHAIDQAGADDHLRHRYLHALCFVLWRLAQRRNDPAIMQKAVDAGRQAIAATPSGSPEYADALSDLGIALRGLSVMFSEPSLFDEGLDCARRAVASAPADHPDLGLFHVNLGNALQQLASESGDLRLLDEAIEQKRIAVQVTPVSHSERHIYLSGLGACLMVKYGWLLDSTALLQAVDAFSQAEREVPENDHRKARYRSNMGAALRVAAQATGQPRFLAAALTALTGAVEATEEDHPDRALRLAHLAQVHRAIADARGEPPDAEAYRRAREALAAARTGSPYRAICMCELSRILLEGYDSSADIARLSEAIKYVRQAVAEAQSLDVRAQARLVLASALRRLYETSGQGSDLRAQILDQLRCVVTAPGPTDDRISAARQWADLCAGSDDWEGVLHAVEAALELVPILVSRRLGRHDQHVAASHLQGLASAGAAAALYLDRPEQAVELLEAGRGAVLARALESRTDLYALHAQAPNLADAYLRMARELDTAAYEHAVTPEGEEQSRRREQIAAQFDQVLAEIRRLPDFAYFLAPLPHDELAKAAEAGPVVIVNVSPYRCDALMVNYRHGTQSISLPELSLQTAMDQADRLMAATMAAADGSVKERAQAQREVHEILAWLWDAVAGPILSALGFNTRASDHRLWWCPVGPLTYLPLHAAGRHLEPARTGPCTVLDCAVSSYTSTLRALLHSRRSSTMPVVQEGDLLLVTMPDTPEADPLPGADAETEQLTGLITSTSVLRASQASRAAVLAAMPRHRIAHFACHGVNDTGDITASRLLLHDHSKSPLTVAEISALHLEHAELAYLSACDTTRTLPALADEAVHITGAFQLAGYRQVIGTLWSVGDQTAIRVATDVYQDLIKGPAKTPQTTHAARALHQAILRLRDDSRKAPTEWSAYVHVGG